MSINRRFLLSVTIITLLTTTSSQGQSIFPKTRLSYKTVVIQHDNKRDFWKHSGSGDALRPAGEVFEMLKQLEPVNNDD